MRRSALAAARRSGRVERDVGGAEGAVEATRRGVGAPLPPAEGHPGRPPGALLPERRGAAGRRQAQEARRRHRRTRRRRRRLDLGQDQAARLAGQEGQGARQDGQEIDDRREGTRQKNCMPLIED